MGSSEFGTNSYGSGGGDCGDGVSGALSQKHKASALDKSYYEFFPYDSQIVSLVIFLNVTGVKIWKFLNPN